MPITTRDIILSGQNQYVPFTDGEKQAYLVELWYTGLTTQIAQYRNDRWFPSRKFFGRLVASARDYVIEEVEIVWDNQLVFREFATQRFLQHHASCMQIENQHLKIDALVSSRFITDTVLPGSPEEDAIGAAAFLALRANAQKFLGALPSSFTQQILQQDYVAYKPRPTPGLECDGFYYSMENAASGKMSIRTYLFDEACVFPNTFIDSSPNNRAAPPATAGGSDVPGGPGVTPPPTGSAPPPPSGQPPAPTSEDPNPGGPPIKPTPGGNPGQIPGRAYTVVAKFISVSAGTRTTTPVPRIAPISGVQTRVEAGGYRIWFYTDSPPGFPGKRENPVVTDFVNDPFPERQITSVTLAISPYTPPG